MSQWSARCDCRHGHNSNSGRCRVTNVTDPNAQPGGAVYCERCRAECPRVLKPFRNLVISGPREDGELLFWSNEDGWVDKASATRFSFDEISVYIAMGRMPIGSGPVHDEKGEV